MGWIGLLTVGLLEGKGWPEAFESPGLGARALAMGGAFIGLADDRTAIYWNPAGLARLQGLNAGFNLFSPRFNDYDGDSVHNFDPENFRLEQGDVFPRLHPSEPSRFNEKWSNNFAVNPSFAMVFGNATTPQPAVGFDPQGPREKARRFAKGWTLAAGVHSPIGNLLSWDDLVRDPDTGAWITADYQAFMAIVNLQVAASREILPGLYVGLGGNLVYTGSKLRAVKYYTGSADSSRPDYQFKFKTWAWDLRPEGVLGLLYQPHPRLSLGAVYRTGTTMDLEGRARIGNTLLDLRESSRYAQEVIIPATYGVGMSYRIRPDWLATADWQGTDWAPMRAKLHFERPGRALVNLRGDLRGKRSSRLRFGSEYRLSPRWRLRGGYFYGSPSLPEGASSLTTIVDVPLHTVSLGGSREWGNWTLDFALAYRFGGRDVEGGKHHFDALLSILSFGWRFSF